MTAHLRHRAASTVLGYTPLALVLGGAGYLLGVWAGAW